MRLSLREWRPRHLLAAWGAYWTALAVVVLGRPALLVWRLANGPEGRGSASANFEDAMLHLRVVQNDVGVWDGSAHLMTIGLWVAGPPLLLWLLWLVLRPRRAADGAAPSAPPAAASVPPAQLGGAGAGEVERAVAERAAAERAGAGERRS